MFAIDYTRGLYQLYRRRRPIERPLAVLQDSRTSTVSISKLVAPSWSRTIPYIDPIEAMLARQLLSTPARVPAVLRRSQPFCSTSLAQTTLSIKAALERASTTTTADAEEITLNGWIRSCRRQKHVSFAVLNDGSNAKGIQAVLPKGMEVERVLSLVAPRTADTM